MGLQQKKTNKKIQETGVHFNSGSWAANLNISTGTTPPKRVTPDGGESKSVPVKNSLNLQ
jgi:hypothetical protein